MTHNARGVRCATINMRRFPRLFDITTPAGALEVVRTKPLPGDVFLGPNRMFSMSSDGQAILHKYDDRLMLTIQPRYTALYPDPVLAYARVIKQCLLLCEESTTFTIGISARHPNFRKLYRGSLRSLDDTVIVQFNRSGIMSTMVMFDGDDDHRILLEFREKPTAKRIHWAFTHLMEPRVVVSIRKPEREADMQLLSKFIKPRSQITIDTEVLCIVGTAGEHSELLLELPQQRVSVGKIDRYPPCRNDGTIWLDGAEIRWPYHACVIREFCVAVHAFKLPLNVLVHVFLFVPTMRLQRVELVVDSTVCALIAMEMVEARRKRR